MRYDQIVEALKNKEWYVFGDSVSKGVILNEERNKYVVAEKSFVRLLADKLSVSVKNFSVFGATVGKGISIFKRQDKKIQENGIAILEFGGNDCDFNWADIAEAPDEEHIPNMPISTFMNKYREFVVTVKEKGLLPIILSLPPLVADRYFESVSKGLNKENILKFLGGSTNRIYQWQEQYNAVLPQLAYETGAFFIDIRRAFLEHLHPEKYICQDGIHPNEEGHRLIADFVYQYLSSLPTVSNQTITE